MIENVSEPKLTDAERAELMNLLHEVGATARHMADPREFLQATRDNAAAELAVESFVARLRAKTWPDREMLARALQASAHHQLWGVRGGSGHWRGACDCGWEGDEQPEEEAHQDAAHHVADHLLAALDPAARTERGTR